MCVCEWVFTCLTPIIWAWLHFSPLYAPEWRTYNQLLHRQLPHNVKYSIHFPPCPPHTLYHNSLSNPFFFLFFLNQIICFLSQLAPNPWIHTVYVFTPQSFPSICALYACLYIYMHLLFDILPMPLFFCVWACEQWAVRVYMLPSPNIVLFLPLNLCVCVCVSECVWERERKLNCAWSLTTDVWERVCVYVGGLLCECVWDDG